MSLLLGTRLGSYEIGGPLGRGGMGEVYRARDTRLGREVAIKVLPEDLARDVDLLARLEREAKMVASLNHPNIVTLYSIEEAGGIRFLTMELVDGQSLATQLASGGLPVARVLDVAIAVADALAVAHGKGVVHRDLKPANVMVTKDGRVKVLDFGLAKLTVAESAAPMDVTQGAIGAAPLTETGMVLGSGPYMAPEQLTAQTVDARTDLFALGIMMYELLTGWRPFTGASGAEVSSSILRDTPAPLAVVRPEVPRDLERIVGRCLEKEPEDRFQTAKDVRNELKLVKRDLQGAAAVSSVTGSRATSSARMAFLAPLPDDLPSIAVLPFVNLSADEENEYFADGLTEELLNVLAKIRGLHVAARTSSFHFKGKTGDMESIGRQLKVATILEGSVRKAGKRVRITAQLIKVADGYHLWSETYDRELDDIFAVQDDITQSVVKELRTALLGEKVNTAATVAVKAEVEVAAKGRAENAEAHRLYLQGRFLMDRQTREGLERGIGYFRQAAELDPGYALAWVGMSQAYSLQAAQGLVPITEGSGRARAAAERALELEPDLAEGHLALGSIRRLYDWDWKGADASLRRALELAPGNADAIRAMGLMEATMGRLKEAIALGRRAVALDPLSVPFHRSLGLWCFRAGLLEEAEQTLRNALELSPQSSVVGFFLNVVHLAQGRVEEALAAIEHEPDEAFRLTGLVLANHDAGRPAESEGALRELIEKYSQTGAYQIAEACAYRGETDSALEWLERAYAQRDPGLAGIKANALLGNLHADQRWQTFLEKMGLAD